MNNDKLTSFIVFFFEFLSKISNIYWNKFEDILIDHAMDEITQELCKDLEKDSFFDDLFDEMEDLLVSENPDTKN